MFLMSVTEKMLLLRNMYIVYSHVKAKSRHLVSLQKPDEGEATGGDFVTLWLHAECTSYRPLTATPRNRKLILCGQR